MSEREDYTLCSHACSKASRSGSEPDFPCLFCQRTGLPRKAVMPVGPNGTLCALEQLTALRTKWGLHAWWMRTEKPTEHLRAVRVQGLRLLVTVPTKMVFIRPAISDPISTRTSAHPTCRAPNTADGVHVLVRRRPCRESHPVEHIVLDHGGGSGYGAN